jgi:hypothetical protein
MTDAGAVSEKEFEWVVERGVTRAEVAASNVGVDSKSWRDAEAPPPVCGLRIERNLVLGQHLRGLQLTLPGRIEESCSEGAI